MARDRAKEIPVSSTVVELLGHQKSEITTKKI